MRTDPRLLLRLPAQYGRRLRQRPRSRRGWALIALSALLLIWLVWPSGDRETWPRQHILDALRMVESSDLADPPDGDGGLAIGPYQIHWVYWIDASSSDTSLGADYQRCRERSYAERVIDAYMRCYAADAWERGAAEVIARVHNGGPGGAESDATLGYWRKVREALPDR